MATKGTGFTIPFKVVVRSTGADAGDESANLTCFLIADGVRTEATNAATYAGANGWHLLAVTDAEADADTLALDGACSTDDRFVQPVSYDLERNPLGSGANVVTVTVADGDGATYEGVLVSVSNDGGTTVGASGYTDADGEVVFHVASDDWRLTAAANGAQDGGYTDATIAADDDVAITVVAVALPTPAPAGYCAVRCLAEAQDGDDPVGTFAITQIFSPTTRTSGGVTSAVVFGADTVALASGVGTLNILQGAVVSLKLVTSFDERVYDHVLIPETGNADAEDLEAAP